MARHVAGRKPRGWEVPSIGRVAVVPAMSAGWQRLLPFAVGLAFTDCKSEFGHAGSNMGGEATSRAGSSQGIAGGGRPGGTSGTSGSAGTRGGDAGMSNVSGTAGAVSGGRSGSVHGGNGGTGIEVEAGAGGEPLQPMGGSSPNGGRGGASAGSGPKPEAGDGGEAPGGSAGAPGEPVVPSEEFAAVVAVMTNHCALSGCHGNGGGLMHARLVPDEQLHTRLTQPLGVRVCNGEKLAVAFAPEQSLLLKIVQPDPPCGSIMPYACDFGARDCLGPAEIAILEAWIAAGTPP